MGGILFVWFFDFFFFKQKTAYEMRISDWSSDVCSSDLDRSAAREEAGRKERRVDLRQADQARGQGEQMAVCEAQRRQGARRCPDRQGPCRSARGREEARR